MTSAAIMDTSMMDDSTGSASESSHSSKSSMVTKEAIEYYECPQCLGHIRLPSQRFQSMFQFAEDHLRHCTGTRSDLGAIASGPQPTPLDLLMPLQPRRAWSAEDSRRKKLEEDPDAYEVTPHSVTCAGCHRPIRLNGTGRYYAANWNKHKMGCKNTRASNSGTSRSMESKFNGRVAAFRVVKPAEGDESRSHNQQTSSASKEVPIPSSSSSQASTSESGSVDMHPPPSSSSPYMPQATHDTSVYLKRWSDTYLSHNRRNSLDAGAYSERSPRMVHMRSSPIPSPPGLPQSATRIAPGSRALRKEGSEGRVAPYRYGTSADGSRASGVRYPVVSHAPGSQPASPVIASEGSLTGRPMVMRSESRHDDRLSTGVRRHRPLSLRETRRLSGDDHPYFPSRVPLRHSGPSAQQHDFYARKEQGLIAAYYDGRSGERPDPLRNVMVIPLTSRRLPGGSEPYSPRPRTPMSAPPYSYSSTSPTLFAASRDDRKRKSMDDIFYADIEDLRLPGLRTGNETGQEQQPCYSLPPFKSLTLDLPSIDKHPMLVRPDRSSSLPPFLAKRRARLTDSSGESADDASDVSSMANGIRSPRVRYSQRSPTDDTEVTTPRLKVQHQVSEERLAARLHPVWKWEGGKEAKASQQATLSPKGATGSADVDMEPERLSHSSSRSPELRHDDE